MIREISSSNDDSSEKKPEVVVITGASGGVGRATAQASARLGAHIGLLARGHEGLANTRKRSNPWGGRAIPIPTDVAYPDQVEAAAERIENEFGPIDIWVNNAMTTAFSPFKDVTPEEFKRATEVTYLGAVYGTMAVIKRMLPRDRGNIVQIGSALAYVSIPLQAPYCGAKHGIKGFTDSLRIELIHDRSNIHLTMVEMPALNTPQFSWCRTHLPRHPQPVPPIFQPEVAAEAIVWAAHNKRREVYMGEPTVIGIIAKKLFPGLVDYYLAQTGYDSQQTDGPVEPNRPDNLFEPAPGDHGAHGIFDDRAHEHSPQLRATTHRWLLALAGVGVAGAIYTALSLRKKDYRPAIWASVENGLTGYDKFHRHRHKQG